MKNFLFAYLIALPLAFSTSTVNVPASNAPVFQSPHTQPDFSITPGAICTPDNPDFIEYRYPERIAYCQRSLPKQVKQLIATKYNVHESTWSQYEFDHLIPLGIGGANGVENIWPQPRNTVDAEDKNKLEQELFNLISKGAITQREAVARTYAWFKVRQRLDQ